MGTKAIFEDGQTWGGGQRDRSLSQTGFRSSDESAKNT